MRAVLESYSQPWRNGKGTFFEGTVRNGINILLLSYLFVYLFFGDDISVSQNMHLGLELWNLWISSPWFTKQPYVYHKSHSITLMWRSVYNQQKMLRETRSHAVTTTASKYNFALWKAVFRYFRNRFSLYNLSEHSKTGDSYACFWNKAKEDASKWKSAWFWFTLSTDKSQLFV